MTAGGKRGLAAALAAGAAACIVEIEIVHSQAIEVGVSSPGFAAAWPMDMANEFQVTLHRAQVAQVRVELITVRVGRVYPENQWRSFGGTLKARPAGGAPGGRELVIGSFQGLPVQEGASAELELGLKVKPTDADGVTLNQFLVEVLRGDGRFDLWVEAQGGEGEAHFNLSAELDLQMGYRQ